MAYKKKIIYFSFPQIHISLMSNRPAANTSSPELLEFTLARYVRIRLQSMHSTVQSENNIQWLVDMPALEKRSFYSFRHIKIGARVFCSGHARLTDDNVCIRELLVFVISSTAILLFSDK